MEAIAPLVRDSKMEIEKQEKALELPDIWA